MAHAFNKRYISYFRNCYQKNDLIILNLKKKIYS